MAMVTFSDLALAWLVVSIREIMYLVGEALVGGRCKGEPAGVDHTYLYSHSCRQRQCIITLVIADLAAVLPETRGDS